MAIVNGMWLENIGSGYLAPTPELGLTLISSNSGGCTDMRFCCNVFLFQLLEHCYVMNHMVVFIYNGKEFLHVLIA